MQKQNKKSAIVANITSEMLVNSILLPAEAVALVLFSCLVPTDGWVFWVILAILIVSILYFGAMTVYKVYGGRLTVVKISKDKIGFCRRFHRIEIPADKLAIELFDYGSPKSANKYAVIYNKDSQDDSFIFAISMTRALKRLKDYAPDRLLIFIIACTEAAVLEKMKIKEPDNEELLQYIQKELDAREERIIREQKAAKHKKKKGKK